MCRLLCKAAEILFGLYFTGNWDMLLITMHFHIFVDGYFCNLALLFCDPHSSGLYSSTSIRRNVFNLT